jgi:hypothetical protein
MGLADRGRTLLSLARSARSVASVGLLAAVSSAAAILAGLSVNVHPGSTGYVAAISVVGAALSVYWGRWPRGRSEKSSAAARTQPRT